VLAVGGLAVARGATVAVAWPDGGGDGKADKTLVQSAGESSVPVVSPVGPTAAAPAAPEPTVQPSSTGQPPAPSLTPPAGPPPVQPGGTTNKDLTGKVIMIDPGHNPGNIKHVPEISKQVEAGGLRKNCDETGTETNAGYTEAMFTGTVSRIAVGMLRERGATVQLLWQGDVYGPCVDERARRGNDMKADAVVSVHGDGGPANGHGFHVILPAKVTKNGVDTTPILERSRTLGVKLADAFAAATGSPRSTYIGGGTGLDTRSDLGGLNLSTVPKVFIECGNMRNATDAKNMSNPEWQAKAALGLADGITAYLTT
jgi:N-acetylmuramoyl-L-alanine amidase